MGHLLFNVFSFQKAEAVSSLPTTTFPPLNSSSRPDVPLFSDPAVISTLCFTFSHHVYHLTRNRSILIFTIPRGRLVNSSPTSYNTSPGATGKVSNLLFRYQ